MTPTILILVGITGDLAKRKLLPALAHLARSRELPEKFRVIGITRKPDARLASLFAQEADASYLEKHLELFHMDLAAKADYERLAAKLSEVEKDFGAPAQRLFYLSVPPSVSQAIIEYLGASDLAKAPDTKLLLEKPSGMDLASAEELIGHVEKYFNDEQVYRIDHFLAKDFAQDMVRTRQRDAELERAWNKDSLGRIEILATEAIGIEGRAAFYEQTGALRDLVQSHLLELAALTLMQLPASPQEQPAARRAALATLSATTPARRGQYDGYREEVKNSGSVVETFVLLTLKSSDERFSGVPITLMTGKALDTKTTEIRLYPSAPDGAPRVWSDAKQARDAYEKVFSAALAGERELFVEKAEVLECWRIIAPVQEAWKASADDLRFYPKGSKPSDI